MDYQDLDPFTDIVKFSGRHGTQAHKPPQLPPHLRTVRGHISASHAEPAGAGICTPEFYQNFAGAPMAVQQARPASVPRLNLPTQTSPHASAAVPSLGAAAQHHSPPYTQPPQAQQHLQKSHAHRQPPGAQYRPLTQALQAKSLHSRSPPKQPQGLKQRQHQPMSAQLQPAPPVQHIPAHRSPAQVHSQPHHSPGHASLHGAGISLHQAHSKASHNLGRPSLPASVAHKHMQQAHASNRDGPPDRIPSWVPELRDTAPPHRAAAVQPTHSPSVQASVHRHPPHLHTSQQRADEAPQQHAEHPDPISQGRPSQPQSRAASRPPQTLKALPPKFAALLAQRRAASLGPNTTPPSKQLPTEPRSTAPEHPAARSGHCRGHPAMCDGLVAASPGVLLDHADIMEYASPRQQLQQHQHSQAASAGPHASTSPSAAAAHSEPVRPSQPRGPVSVGIKPTDAGEQTRAPRSGKAPPPPPPPLPGKNPHAAAPLQHPRSTQPETYSSSGHASASPAQPRLPAHIRASIPTAAPEDAAEVSHPHVAGQDRVGRKAPPPPPPPPKGVLGKPAAASSLQEASAAPTAQKPLKPAPTQAQSGHQGRLTGIVTPADLTAALAQMRPAAQQVSCGVRQTPPVHAALKHASSEDPRAALMDAIKTKAFTLRPVAKSPGEAAAVKAPAIQVTAGGLLAAAVQKMRSTLYAASTVGSESDWDE